MKLHFIILCQENQWSAAVAQPGSETAACRYSKLSALAQEMMCWYWDDEKHHPRQDPALIRNVFKVQQGTSAQRTRPRRARVDLIAEACVTQWHNGTYTGQYGENKGWVSQLPTLTTCEHEKIFTRQEDTFNNNSKKKKKNIKNCLFRIWKKQQLLVNSLTSLCRSKSI